jgi:hypothetical protein
MRRRRDADEGVEGFRYVTGHAPYRSQDEMFRDDQQRRIDAREGDPDDAGELEVDASAAWPPGEEPDAGGETDDVRDPWLADEPPEGRRPFLANDPDVDTQGRVSLDDGTRDWAGDPWADAGEPRLDEGDP